MTLKDVQNAGIHLAMEKKCLCKVNNNSKSYNYITECYNLGGAIWHPRCGPGPDAKTEVDGPMSIDGQVSS